MEVSDRAPVKVFACVTSSAWVGPEQLETRGAAIMAAVLSLQASHPVELFLYTDLCGRADECVVNAFERFSSILITRIETQPLELSTAAWSLAHQGFARQIMFGPAYAKMGFNSGWGGDKLVGIEDIDNANSPRNKMMKEALGMNDHDLMIPGAFISDLILSDPVQWVKNVLASYQLAE